MKIILKFKAYTRYTEFLMKIKKGLKFFEAYYGYPHEEHIRVRILFAIFGLHVLLT